MQPVLAACTTGPSGPQLVHGREAVGKPPNINRLDWEVNENYSFHGKRKGPFCRRMVRRQNSPILITGIRNSHYG
jgi:hypothetical protein